jgi:hypothetical protein
LVKSNRASGHRIAHAEALALARAGRLRAARQSSGRAADLARQEREPEVAATYIAARAVWEALCGNSAEARTTATAALELSTGRDVEYAVGLALALPGSSARSEALLGDLEKRFPKDTFVEFTYAPVLRALALQGKSKPRIFSSVYAYCSDIESAREEGPASSPRGPRPVPRGAPLRFDYSVGGIVPVRLRAGVYGFLAVFQPA